MTKLSNKITVTVLIVFFVGLSGCARFRCGTCSANISGTWGYYVSKHNDPNVPIRRTVTLNQIGYDFSGVNDYHTINGTVLGNRVYLTLVVTGETMEGYVLEAEGSYFDGRKIAAVFTTSHGETGAWLATRE